MPDLVARGIFVRFFSRSFAESSCGWPGCRCLEVAESAAAAGEVLGIDYQNDRPGYG